jgi:hypothetical protein
MKKAANKYNIIQVGLCLFIKENQKYALFTIKFKFILDYGFCIIEQILFIEEIYKI